MDKYKGSAFLHFFNIGNLPYSATSDDITHYFGKRGVPIQQV